MSQKDVNYRKRKHTFDQLMKTATDIDRQIHAACLSNVCVEERTAVHEQFFPRTIDETGRMQIPDFDPHSFDLLSSESSRVPHIAIKRINGLLREHGIDVPKSARTHLKTVKKSL